MNHFDGKWIGPIVDKMTEMLIEFAEEADEQNLMNPEVNQNDITSSESKNTD